MSDVKTWTRQKTFNAHLQAAASEGGIRHSSGLGFCFERSEGLRVVGLVLLYIAQHQAETFYKFCMK